MTRRSALLATPLAFATAAIAKLRPGTASNPEKQGRAIAPDVVRQSELQEIIDAHDAQERRCITMVHRLAAGATIEPGRWTAEGDPEEATFSECCGLSADGLNISESQPAVRASGAGGLVQYQPDAVRQSELAEIIRLSNQAEIRAANIRRRLDAGADFERGRYGVTTLLLESVDWHEQHCGIGRRDGVDDIVGLTIQRSEEIARKEIGPRKLRPGELVRF